jgi:signal transduction histidine kinase
MKFFHRLSNKLVVTLLGLLLILSTGYISFAIWSTPLFLQELNQKLNLDLANNIVKEKKLMIDHKINHDALQSVFMGLMVVNPIIEVYLTDINGNLLSYSAPKGAVKLDRVNLAPVKRFIKEEQPLPVLGTDPRNPLKQKVFSAAPIYQKNKLQGYLYIVLGGQEYDSLVELLKSSYMLKLWTASIGISLFIASIFGFLIFRHITKRLTILTAAMETFKQNGFNTSISLAERFNGKPGDEIDKLGATFREMAERITHQVKQLEHNDSSRRELVANVSHDLRTPLASLHGYLETLSLKKQQLSSDEQHLYIDIALQHCNRLQKLISELFELSTLENRGAQLHFEPFSMSELVQDVSQKFQLDAKNKNIRLAANIPNQPAFVSADISLIQRVLENLIENAIKYTPDGGSININLDNGKNNIATSITDTGQGIAGEDLPHIFDRFYRVDKQRQTEGTGLGLAIAQRIIQLHNSTIDVVSLPDTGTTLSFSLPVAQFNSL